MRIISATLLTLVNLGQCLVTDIPTLNGPIPPTNLANIKFGKTRTSEFQHPGIWHSHEDLKRMRNGVTQNQDPWASAFKNFSADSYSLSSYTMQGPKPIISRGSISNYTSFTNDARAAWQNAIMWYITRDQAHWDKSITILDQSGSNLTSIIGTDRSLLVGLDGQFFVNAAEIMRWEGNWTEADTSYKGGKGFSVQLYWLFARQSVIVGQANYGMASITALLSFAVYLDDLSMYNYALYMYQNDLCGGLQGNVDVKTGQGAESGRDQSHATSALFWAAQACRVVQSQTPQTSNSNNMFTLHNSTLLKGAEYGAKFNLNYSVDYDPSYYRCEAVLVNGPWDTISSERKGIDRPIWDLLYYTVNRQFGLETPYLAELKSKKEPEGRFLTADSPGWGDLIWGFGEAEASNRSSSNSSSSG